MQCLFIESMKIELFLIFKCTTVQIFIPMKLFNTVKRLSVKQTTTNIKIIARQTLLVIFELGQYLKELDY